MPDLSKAFRYSFSLSIAGIVVLVQHNNHKISEFYNARYDGFLLDGAPSLIVKVVEREVHYCRQAFSPEITFDGGIVSYYSTVADGCIKLASGEAELVISHEAIDEVDYFLRLVYAYLAFQHGGVLIHGAGIIHQQKGYVFLGHSGSGKTTVCRLSSLNDFVLNDDLLVLMPIRSSWWAYSTPFWNPDQVVPGNHSVSIEMMFYLIQDQKVRSEAIPLGQAVAELISNVPIIASDIRLGKALVERCTKICETLQVFHLYFLPDASFWQIIDVMIVQD
jgi:hypothetical protein